MDLHISDSLSQASQEGQSDTVKALLDNLTPDQQLKLISIEDKDGRTALHLASQRGHTDTVKALLHNLTPEQQQLLMKKVTIISFMIQLNVCRPMYVYCEINEIIYIFSSFSLSFSLPLSYMKILRSQ